ncbi:hypothetical protein [Pseudomonas fluorescens]|uniref:hypothetical protein n=1 Tax=Pseudomonas fluorescens TaxID=294 RepID=UPI0005C68E45|nr:hypothetical protein [Pseudomonas fluorescens]
MNSDKIREDFEAWVLRRAENTTAGVYPDLLARYDEPPRDYRQSWVYSAWEGWKARREPNELSELKAECELLRRAGESLWDEVAQLKADKQALIKDVDRYRYLRSRVQNLSLLSEPLHENIAIGHDKWIDSRMELEALSENLK